MEQAKGQPKKFCCYCMKEKDASHFVTGGYCVVRQTIDRAHAKAASARINRETGYRY